MIDMWHQLAVFVALGLLLPLFMWTLWTASIM